MKRPPGERERLLRLIQITVAGGVLIVLLGASYKLAANNEQVVLKLGGRPPTGSTDVRFQFLR